MTKVGSTDNGRSYMTAMKGGALDYRRPLARMDGKRLFAYSLWHYPDDVQFEKVKTDDIEEYLQCAGSAEAMTVEVREDDGADGYAQYVLAREPVTGEPSEEISWDAYSTLVHPEEVFTAEQATALFECYFDTGQIPADVPRRRLRFD